MRLFILLLFLVFGCTSKTKEQTTSNDMKDWNGYFLTIYQNFNDRNIDFVISNMTPDVKWANGMDGGFVYGHEGVREYWTRQFKLVNSKVTPIDVSIGNGKIIIKVHQVAHDLDGKLLADETVKHIFKMDGDKIAQFDIEK
jgi:hypothetical protein